MLPIPGASGCLHKDKDKDKYDFFCNSGGVNFGVLISYISLRGSHDLSAQGQSPAGPKGRQLCRNFWYYECLARSHSNFWQLHPIVIFVGRLCLSLASMPSLLSHNNGLWLSSKFLLWSGWSPQKSKWQHRDHLHKLQLTNSLLAAADGPEHPGRLHDQLSDREARGCVGLHAMRQNRARRPDKS